jgi:predicted TIM-barrel enzyme
MLPIPCMPGIDATSVLNVGLGWLTGLSVAAQAASSNAVAVSAVLTATETRWVRRDTTVTSVVG